MQVDLRKGSGTLSLTTMGRLRFFPQTYTLIHLSESLACSPTGTRVHTQHESG